MDGDLHAANEELQRVRKSIKDSAFGEDFSAEVEQLLLARIVTELAEVRNELTYVRAALADLNTE